MGIDGCLSPRTIFHQTAVLRNPIPGMVMLRKSQLHVKKAISFRIRSSKDQVFEDHSMGIICYKDDSGELICEGLDEGPRFLPQPPLLGYPLRDTTIHDLLQQRWIKILEDKNSKNGALVEERSCNGFNTLH